MAGAADLDEDRLTQLALNWDGLADEYAARLGDELSGKPFDVEWLAAFARAVPAGGPVADVGCGPGHITRHLAGLGLDVGGYDLCPRMVARAAQDAPSLRFAVHDMRAPLPDAGTWGGVVALYSLIHLGRAEAARAVAGWARALVPGGQLLLAVHRGAGTHREDRVFDRDVPMAITLYERDEVASWLHAADLLVRRCEVRAPYPSEFPSERVYAWAEKRA